MTLLERLAFLWLSLAEIVTLYAMFVVSIYDFGDRRLIVGTPGSDADASNIE
jgi:hypothetical protein